MNTLSLLVGLLVFSGPESTNDDSLFTRVTVKQGETFYGLFGEHADFVARLNRIDPRTLKAGKRLKIPRDWRIIETYSPAPARLDSVAHLEQFVLVNLGEQYLATYEYGDQVWWYPISSGFNPKQTPHKYILMVKKFDEEFAGKVFRDSLPNMSTPAGINTVQRKDSVHVSSVYRTREGIPIPMPWGVNFRPGYWMHAIRWPINSLPGFPASHGCVRLFEKDAEHFYRWVHLGTTVLVTKSERHLPQWFLELSKQKSTSP